MPTYNLIFREDGHGVEKRVELEGQNVACVFSVLEHEAVIASGGNLDRGTACCLG